MCAPSIPVVGGPAAKRRLAKSSRTSARFAVIRFTNFSACSTARSPALPPDPADDVADAVVRSEQPGRTRSRRRSGSAARRGYVSQEAFVLASFLFGQQRCHSSSARDQE